MPDDQPTYVSLFSGIQPEDSTLPSKPLSDTSAEPKWNGTSTPTLFSNDGGPTSPDGETSTSSRQLPTPTAGDAKSARNRKSGRQPNSKHHDGETLTDVVREDRLLPTPQIAYDGRTEEAWSEAKERAAEKHRQGEYAPGTGPPGMMDLQRAVAKAVMPTEASWTSSAEASRDCVSPPAPQDDGKEPQMTAGSGLSSPVWLANWDRDTSSWKTSQVSLLSTEDERFPRFWERWPTSGMTRDGQAFELPTLERHIAASGSSYLQTPATVNRKSERAMRSSAEDGGNGRRSGGGQSSPPGLEQQVETLLHTPTTGDSQPNYDHRASPGYVRAKPVPNLHAQIDELLPTPKTPTGGSEAREAREARGSGGEDLEARLRSLGEPSSPPSESGNE